ncbi:Lipoprotein signal peptidase [metagenome]|uniref:Lipoprotein signal peptidase n=1 Tax=metagenome TaxID=256318 RepID=A0A2P2BWC0_9ZZZZ
MPVMQAARGTSLSSGDHTESPITLPQRTRVRRVFIVTAVLAYALDVGTKILAVERLTGKGRVDVLGDLFGFHLVRNPGAAFSTGLGFTLVFSLLAIVATGVVLWLARRLGSLLWAVGMGLLLAGITGNLTDRLLRDPSPLRGHVVDFLELPNWPIFNVADICLNLGVLIVLIQTVRGVALDGSRTTTKTTPEADA